MVCLNCDGEDFKEQIEEMTQEFKGVTLTVKTPCMVCEMCGFAMLSDEQANKLRVAVNKAYNERAAKGKK